MQNGEKSPSQSPQRSAKMPGNTGNRFNRGPGPHVNGGSSYRRDMAGHHPNVYRPDEFYRNNFYRDGVYRDSYRDVYQEMHREDKGMSFQRSRYNQRHQVPY